MKSTIGSQNGKLAVLLVRGMADVEASIIRTLLLLRLTHKNHCVIIENTPMNKGMLHKVKDYVTWGEIDENTFQELVVKRGQEFKGPLQDSKKKYTYKTLDFKGKKYKPYFALSPPRKGFERKGIKVSFASGGALGYRGEKINQLLLRMM